METVARKYVKTFHCKELYIKAEKELEKVGKKKEAEQKEQEAREKMAQEDNSYENEDESRDVFATFKNYNKGTKDSAGLGKGNISMDNNNGDVLVVERANRYSYKGLIDQKNELFKINQKREVKLDFATFKKMKKKQN